MTLRVSAAVICVTHDSAELLKDFVAALPAGLRGCDARVVVVDSGSEDGTVSRARHLLPDAAVLRLPGNLGYSAGINLGVEHVRRTGGADAFVVVNPDVRLHEGCIRRLIDELVPGRTGIAVPRLIDEHSRLLFSLRRCPTRSATWAEGLLGAGTASRLHLPGEVVRDVASYETARPAAWATGGLLVISDDCSKVVGGWDETYFLYEEEVDFCLRAADAGYELHYVPSVVATRIIGAPRPTAWAYGLMRVNRWRHMARRSNGPARSIRCGLLLADVIRVLLGRPEARAGVWALWRGAMPADVVRRYRAESTAAQWTSSRSAP